MVFTHNVIPENESAFPHRKGNLYKIQYLANWDEEGEESERYYIDFVRTLHDFMSPYVSKNPRQAYYNYRDLDLGVNQHQDYGCQSYLDGKKYGIQYFGNNFHRLVKVKKLVDPRNYFKNEQSIPPFPHDLVGDVLCYSNTTSAMLLSRVKGR